MPADHRRHRRRRTRCSWRRSPSSRDVRSRDRARSRCAACAPDRPGPRSIVDRELAHVAALAAIGPRPGDSDASRAAPRAYIDAQLARRSRSRPRRSAMSTCPAIDVLGTTFRERASRPRRRSGSGRAVRADRARRCSFMAHYDTVPRQPRRGRQRGRGRRVDRARARAPRASTGAAGDARVHRERRRSASSAPRRSPTRHGDEVELAIALDLIGGSGRLVAQRREQADRPAPRCSGSRARPIAPASSSTHRCRIAWSAAGGRRPSAPITACSRVAASARFTSTIAARTALWIDTAYHSPRDVLARVDRASLDEIGAARCARSSRSPPPRTTATASGCRSRRTWSCRAGACSPVDLALALARLLGFGALALSGRAARSRTRRGRSGSRSSASRSRSPRPRFANHPIDLDPDADLARRRRARARAASLIVLGVLGLVDALVARRAPVDRRGSLPRARDRAAARDRPRTVRARRRRARVDLARPRRDRSRSRHGSRAARATRDRYSRCFRPSSCCDRTRCSKPRGMGSSRREFRSRSGSRRWSGLRSLRSHGGGGHVRPADHWGHSFSLWGAESRLIGRIC